MSKDFSKQMLEYKELISTAEKKYAKILVRVFNPSKGQIISECPYEIIVYPKIATKKFPRFLPWPLRRGQNKNFGKPVISNNP